MVGLPQLGRSVDALKRCAGVSSEVQAQREQDCLYIWAMVIERRRTAERAALASSAAVAR